MSEHFATHSSFFFTPESCTTRVNTYSLSFLFAQWADTDYSTQWCYENFIQHRSMKRARDVRDQLERLCERVEIELQTTKDTVLIRKVRISVGYSALGYRRH